MGGRSFFITYFKNRKRFIFPSIFLVLGLLCLIIPKAAGKNKLIFHIYDSYNITALQTINNGLSSFILYQNTNRYDKYYMDAFSQFLSFSGIKEAEITFIGFKEADVLNQIKGKELIFANTEEKPKTLEMDFYGHNIIFDMNIKKIYINEYLKMDINDNPSFYYSYSDRIFKIKNPRKE